MKVFKGGTVAHVQEISAKGGQMRVQRGPVLVLMMVLEFVLGAFGATDPRARALVSDAALAMGGEERLRGLHSLEIKGIGHRYMLEQSERPEGPWLIDYFQIVEQRDLARERIRRDTNSRGCDSTPKRDEARIRRLCSRSSA